MIYRADSERYNLAFQGLGLSEGSNKIHALVSNSIHTKAINKVFEKHHDGE